MNPSVSRILLLWVGLFLAHSFFLMGVGQRLYSREHYQFFPMVLVAVAGVVWFSLKDYDGSFRSQVSVRVMLYGLAAGVTFGAAAYLNSNWLGTAAALLAGWTLVWFTGGKKLASELRGPLSLLLLIFPLPLNYDSKIIIGLQKIATEFASQMLDLSGIRHLPSGVTIKTLQKNFLVEEACSGIHSLFSCLCVVGVVCTLFRYGFFRALFVLTSAVFWVIVANAVRVFSIVYCYALWGWHLDEGLAHEALGIFTYIVALGFTYSCHHLLLFVVPIRVQKNASNAGTTKLSDFGSARKKLERFLNEPRLGESASFIAGMTMLVAVYAPFLALIVGGYLNA